MEVSLIHSKLKEWSSIKNYCTHSWLSVWKPFLCFVIFTKKRGSNNNYCTHSWLSVWKPFLCFVIFTKKRGSNNNYCTHSWLSVWKPFLCFVIFTKQRGSNISHQVLIIINWYIPHYLHYMFTIMFNDVNIMGMYLASPTIRCC